MSVFLKSLRFTARAEQAPQPFKKRKPMPTYTTNIGITKLVEGQEAAHVTVNEALDVLDSAVAGLAALDLTGLTTLNVTPTESTNMILQVTATTAACTLTIQAVPKVWVFINGGAHAVTIQCAGQTTPPTVAAGATKVVVCSGTKILVV
jgi:hypothetical protein